MDPLRTFEKWTPLGHFSVRREVKLITTSRRATPKSYSVYKHLKGLNFEAAHAWPLQWGGTEVKKGLFWAHKTVNGSFQKRVENALKRLTEKVNGTGIKIFVTTDIERYLERNLLKSATYRIEAVSLTGKRQVVLLGEVTVNQNLTSEVRKALVDGLDVDFDRLNIVTVDGEIFTNELDELIEGLRTSGNPISSNKHGSPKGTSDKATTERGLSDEPSLKGGSSQKTYANEEIPDLKHSPESRLKPNDLDNPNVRKIGGKTLAKVEKFTNRLRIGFGADLIIQLAVGIMLGILNSKLEEVNEAGIVRAYKGNVFNQIRAINPNGPSPTLGEIVNHIVHIIRNNEAIQFATELNADLNKPMYATYSYDLFMEEQAKNTSDVIVWFINGLKFAEVFHSIVPIGNVTVDHSTYYREYPIQFKRTRMSDNTDLIRYRYTHNMLLWDPKVGTKYFKLRDVQVELFEILKNITNTHLQYENAWAVIYIGMLNTYVNDFDFYKALLLLKGKSEFGTAAIPKEKDYIFKEFRNKLLIADAMLEPVNKWEKDKRALFIFYLGKNPMETKKRAKARIKKEKVQERFNNSIYSVLN